MAKYLADITFSLVVLLGSIYLWFVADAFPSFARYQNVDSDFWPKTLLVASGLLAAGLLYQNVSSAISYNKKHSSHVDNDDIESGKPTNLNRLIFSSILLVGYFVGLKYVGFMIATIIFLSIAVRLFDYSNRLVKAIFPFIFTAIILIVFAKILSLTLPRGIGIFYDINLIFY